MDWIRRNWPDLLIGLALLAVIAGIIATLLNGGSFLPFGGSSTPPSVSGPAPSTPSSTPSSSQTNPGGQTTAESGVTPVAPGGTATIPGVSSGAPGTTTATTETTPSAEAGSEVTPVAPGASPSTGPAASTSTSASTDDASPSASSAAAASSLPSAPFRIGVGSYGQPDNAERRAEAFREAGYPVFTAQQGQYTVVLIGPYDSRSEAEAIQDQIRSSGLEENPILYQVEAEAAASASPDTTGEADGNTTASTGAASESAAASAGERYIQVGAYNSPELAEPQRERLEQLGYSTTLQRTEGSSLLRLWIGPFSAERLDDVRAQLDELGIDNFVPAQ